MSSIAEPIAKRSILQPFYLLILFYFLSLSTDLLNLPLGIFKARFSILMGSVTFIVFFLTIRVLRLDRDFLYVALACFASMSISAIAGYHLFACVAFVCYYVFNYFVFFVIAVNLFRAFDPDKILSLYFLSFLLIGAYAAAQVFVSLSGYYLPFTEQKFMSIGRGQGFSYEPSYYALYMTPSVIFQTTKFFLQKREERKIGKIVGANFLFLISTSTGCFFSYLAMVLCMSFLKLTRMVRQIPLLNILGKVFSGLGIVFVGLWMVIPKMVSGLFLKFFWTGGRHRSLQDRWGGIEQFWSIFLDHPILGTGFGGATTYYSQREHLDIDLLDPEILTANAASNVTTEILASLGTVGAMAFASFLYILWRTCRSTLHLPLTEVERINVVSFIVSLGVMFVTLQFNASMMRPYTWVHIGVCVGYMRYLHMKISESTRVVQ